MKVMSLGYCNFVKKYPKCVPSVSSSLPGMVMNDGIKKIFWKNSIPYGTHLNMGKEIRFNSLHFHGARKKLMSQFTQP